MSNRFDKILGRPLWQRLLLVVLVMVAIGAGFYFLVYQQQLNQHQQLAQSRASKQLELDKNRKIANNLPLYKAEYEKIRLQLDEAMKELPMEKEIPTLLSSVADLARDKGLEILRFKPAAEVAKGFYAEVPVELKLAGSYHQAGAFFDAVSKMERIVNIQGLSLGNAKEVDNRMSLNIDCRAITFRFVENPPPANPKKKGRG